MISTFTKSRNNWSNQPAAANLIQRKCSCGQHTIAGGECAECRKKRINLQRRAANVNESPLVSPIVHEVLRSPGQPLDAKTRSFMEPRFEHDFSQVRVHTDPKAARSARAVNAQAYTVGNDVVFESGKYTPETTQGKQILAHELTHVIQQTGKVGSANSLSIQSLSTTTPGDRFEREAESVEQGILTQTSFPTRSFLNTGQNIIARLGGKCLSQKIGYWAAAAALAAACGGAILTSETGVGLVLLGIACVAAIAAYIGAIVSLKECMESDPDADREEIERLRREQERMEERLRQIESLMGNEEQSEE